MASVEEISNLLDSKLGSKLGIEEGETFASKLDDVFARKLGMGKDVTVDLPKMERRLDAIAAVSPDAALEEQRPNVVGYGTIHEKRAMADGALATWTFFKSGDK